MGGSGDRRILRYASTLDERYTAFFQHCEEKYPVTCYNTISSNSVRIPTHPIRCSDDI